MYLLKNLGPRKKIIFQPCLSFCSASALRQLLHIPICATCRALNLSNNPAQYLDNYYFPRPLTSTHCLSVIVLVFFLPLATPIAVAALNATDDAIVVAVDGTGSVTVLDNDSGDTNHLTVVDITVPSFGDVHLENTGILTYTANDAFNGTDAFSYTVTDANWTFIGPENASVSAVAINPSSPDVVYIGTANGGIYKSTDGGSMWHSANNGLTKPISDLTVTSLVVDPTNTHILYAGTNQLVFKSSDGGENWIPYADGLQTIEPSSSDGALLTTRPLVINKLAINPKTLEHLYAATTDGIFKSENGGTTWVQLRDDTALTDTVHDLIVDPLSPDILYASNIDGVHKSDNGGVSWRTLNIETSVFSLAIDPSEPKNVYAVTDPTIYLSRDGGETWAESLGLGPGGQIFIASSLTVDPLDSSTLYATNTLGAYKSTDKGETWTPYENSPSWMNASSLAINPTDSTTLYIGSWSSGVYRSTDGLSTLTKTNNGLFNVDIRSLAIEETSETIYAASVDNAVYISRDSGLTWGASLLPINVNSLVEKVMTSANLPGVVYAGTFSEGVFKSMDSGVTWKEVNTLADIKQRVSEIAIDPALPETVYVGTSGNRRGGVFASTDGGQAWVKINNGLTGVYVTALTIDHANPRTLYAASHGGRNGLYSDVAIYKSTDSGQIWQKVYSDPLVDRPATSESSEYPRIFYSLLVEPTNNSLLYVGTDNAILNSSDGGLTWNEHALPGVGAINELITSDENPSILYAATTQGVYMSTNGGEGWTTINTLAPLGSVLGLAQQRSSPSRLLAATLGQGVVASITPSLATASIKVSRAHTPVTPNVSGSPDLEALQDTLYTFMPEVANVDAKELTFVISNKPEWASFDTDKGTLSGTPANRHVGVTAGIIITVEAGTSKVSLPEFAITVIDVNDPPIAVDDHVAITKHGVLTIEPLVNDLDPDNDSISLGAVPLLSDQHGQLHVTKNGGITYTPPETLAGTDSFIYEAVDSHGASAEGLVFITHNVVENSPIDNAANAPQEETDNTEGSTHGGGGGGAMDLLALLPATLLFSVVQRRHRKLTTRV